VTDWGELLPPQLGEDIPFLIAIHNRSTSALLNDYALFTASTSTKVMLFAVL
jgi:hypothetical protein